MKISNKYRPLMVAIMTLSLVAPPTVFADDDHHGGYGEGYQHEHEHEHGYRYGHYKQRHYKYRRGYSHGGGYYHNGGYYHGKHYGKHKHKHHNGNDGEKWLIGLLVGGLAGYTIGHSRQARAAEYDYPPAPAATGTGYSTPPVVTTSHTDTCLQEREYQTKVIVGGRTVDAYGTACLQPDGSWRRDVPQLASF